MMRITKATFLVGVLLAGTMLVPFDYATRGTDSQPLAVSQSAPASFIQVPAGKALVPFPDQWGGLTTQTIFDEVVYIPQTIGVNPGVVELQLASGMRVLPGARWLNVTLVASNQPRDAQFDFEYISADDRRGVRALSNHATHPLRLDEPMNDWTPDAFTRWRFLVYNDAMETVEAKITIAIARQTGIFPSHIFVVDRWFNQDARVVYDHKDTLRQSVVWRAGVPTPDSKSPAAHVPLRGVPALELGELQVHLYYNSTTPANVHYRPLLSWNSPRGDSYSSDRVNMPPTDEQRGSVGHFLWRIPVEPSMYDNALGSRSRWQIQIDWFGNATEVQEYNMEGDYHFTILAHRDMGLAPEADKA